MTFMASYENYPSGHALKALHKIGKLFLLPFYSNQLHCQLKLPVGFSCDFMFNLQPSAGFFYFAFLHACVEALE